MFGDFNLHDAEFLTSSGLRIVSDIFTGIRANLDLWFTNGSSLVGALEKFHYELQADVSGCNEPRLPLIL